MGKNAERHILERDRPSMEELKEIDPVLLHERSDLLRIKFRIVGVLNAGPKLLLGKIREEFAHHFIGEILIAHFRELGKRLVEHRHRLRDKESSVRAQSLEDCF